MHNVLFQTFKILHLGYDFDISYFIRPGKHETIVYLHGLGSTKYDFFDAVNREGLSNFTLFAFDFPGCGNSNYFDQSTLDIDDLVEITYKMASSLELANLTLIGHSMGGLVALLFAEKHPDKVKRFINVEGNLAPEDCGVFSRKTAQLTWEEFVEQDFLRNLQHQFASSPYFGARIFADKFPGSVNAYAFHDYCGSIVKHSDNSELMSTNMTLPIPKLFIHGEANNSLTYLSDLKENGTKVIEVPGSHHWPHYDNPDFYFEIIGDFIKTS